MNVLAYFHESKHILGICPCCGDVFRLSDATLFTKEPPPLSPFDALQAAQQKLERAEEKFEEREAALREKAVAKGQRAARRRLKAIAGPFIERKIDPQDVKVLFDPIEFVAFRGMTKGSVRSVAFIDRPAETTLRERLQKSVADAVKAGNYDWKVLRISAEGAVAEE